MFENARYNRSRELRAWLGRSGGRIRLVCLPSCAPDLSLIERCWHFLKRKVLFNRVYATFALFKQAFDDFFERLHEHAHALKSLIADCFYLIGKPQNRISSAQKYIM